MEVEGLSPDCNEKGSTTTIVDVVPYRLFEFEEKYSEDLQARLDLLALILEKQPSLTAFIIVYGGRLGTRGYSRFRSDAAKDYLVNARGMVPERFTISQGGYRENQTFEIWLMKRGMTPPNPTPTVDEHYVRFLSQQKHNRRK